MVKSLIRLVILLFIIAKKKEKKYVSTRVRRIVLCGLTEVKCSSGHFISVKDNKAVEADTPLDTSWKWIQMLVLNEHLAVKLSFFVSSLSKSWVRVVRTMILCGAFNHLRRANKLPGYKWSKVDPAHAMKAYEGVEE